MNEETSTVAEKWKKVLVANGYENRLIDRKDFARLTRLSRTWKYILEATNLQPGTSVFEFGCGGGNQLIPLALMGYQCNGIDCSKEVLDRCSKFIMQAEKFSGKTLGIRLICGDFLKYDIVEQYDLVFNFGVIEHFLDVGERKLAIRKMFELCKPGGHVVSAVPNGQHPLRDRMRMEKLGGYQIPEIDYSVQLMEDELAEAGAASIQVIPYNLFAYLTIKPSSAMMKLLMTLYYCLWQVVPLAFIPKTFAAKHAYGLIGIGRKPIQPCSG